MLPSYGSSLLNTYTARSFTYRGKISIAVAASTTFISLFTVPSGYSFYMFPWLYDGNSTGFCVLMNNLTTAGGFSAYFGTNGNGEYNPNTGGPTLVSIYTNGTAANTPKSFDMAAQTQFRLGQAQNTVFGVGYTNSTTAFTLAIIINGFLVPV